MSNKTLQLTDQIYNYLLAVSLREPLVLKKLRDETAKLPSCQMQISPEQGQFMALLVELMGAHKTLEIGVYTGYSSLAVALALPDNGKIVACDIDKAATEIAKNFWQAADVTHKIELHIAPAAQTLDQLIASGEQNTFDFVFIDADKNGYDEYYEKSLILTRPGGLIMLDNTLRNGSVADLNINDTATQSMRLLNKKLHSDARISLSFLPVSDGITLARKR